MIFDVYFEFLLCLEFLYLLMILGYFENCNAFGFKVFHLRDFGLGIIQKIIVT
jgi:hypothetical protein